jgi:hypothetical protein
MEEQLGWISKNMEWAVIPYGKKFMTIHKGQQISVHLNIQKEMKKK